MIKMNNKEQVIEEIQENKIQNIFNIIPNLSDKVMDYNEEKFEIARMLDETFEDKRSYTSEITPSLFLLSGVQSRMKQQFSINELPLALTSKKVIEKIGKNIAYESEESLLSEPNIRAWLGKYEQENKTEIEFNNYFIEYYNIFTKNYLKKSEIDCNIHILDCSILDVNLSNNNYEGSTVTYKGGEKLRGYKIGALRGVTSNGGVIEEICMSTAKTHDLEMSREMIKNTEFLKEGDYLLEDRGFLDISIIRHLHNKGVFIIRTIPFTTFKAHIGM